MKVSKYFSKEELRCPCCGKYCFNQRFLVYLDELREKCNFPLIVNSGCRCEKHNKEIGGSPKSSHLKGLAIDLRVRDFYQRGIIVKNWSIITEKYKLPFRVELGWRYIHIDIDTNKRNNIMWFNVNNLKKYLKEK